MSCDHTWRTAATADCPITVRICGTCTAVDWGHLASEAHRITAPLRERNAALAEACQATAAALTDMIADHDRTLRGPQ